MSTKESFTEDEWKVLLLAPTHAGTYVMTADMSVVGALREMKALAKVMLHHEPPPDAQELVQAIVTEYQERTKNKQGKDAPETEPGQAGEDGREPSRQGLRDVARLLDERCSPEEAAGFKHWLLDIAQSVAEADKEGSHFGIGGVRVTEKEKAALAEIQGYLGL